MTFFKTSTLTGMELISEIQYSWGWIGIHPRKIVNENSFGNLIIEDKDGRFWWLTPEDLTCVVVAQNRDELDALFGCQEFLLDWHMTALVNQAVLRLGELQTGRKYCLKIPSVVGGAYGDANLGTISLFELIGSAGYFAKQIHGLPDGAKFELITS